jgi:triosephosphate isomerase
MAKPILVANWKNYPNSLPEAQSLLKEMGRKRLLYKKLTLFIAPPHVYFELVAKSFAHLASQDFSILEKGTHTGETSLEILKSFGVKLAILGHSERRALGESSEIVSQKVKVALKAGITPLVCVGESVRDNEGEHFEFLREQIKASLTGLTKKEVSKVMLAYEPVWAIGKNAKDAIYSEDLVQTVVFIKKVLADLFGRIATEDVPILYGGSVESANALELMQSTGVRGFLVGHASLKAKSLEIIAHSLFSK